MQSTQIYHEKLTSNRTTALFLILTVLFFCLFSWRLKIASMDWLSIVLLVLACFFLFYTINYRTLEIQINLDCVRLKFGIFSWRIPITNIANIKLDEDLPWIIRNGGAGIHFAVVEGRYRASFNFLEHPRAVIQFTKKVGPVADISFSTSHPRQVIEQVRYLINRD